MKKSPTVKRPHWAASVENAEKRINAAISQGHRPNLYDQLIMGTNYAIIDKWYENAYKDYKNYP